MNIFHAYSLRSLKKNKTRTIVTIIGIILSVAMITAISTIISSITNYGKRYELMHSGNWHVAIINADNDTHNEVVNQNETKLVMSANYEGYAMSNSTNPFKPYFCVQAVNSDFFNNMPITLIEGRIPTNSSEILLPAHYTNYTEDNYNIGDTITLTLGYRTTASQIHLGQRNSLESSQSDEPIKEDLHDIATREYTIVGIMERPNFEYYSAPGFTCLTYYDNNSISYLENSNSENNYNNSYNITPNDVYSDEYILLSNPKYAIPFCENYSNEYFAFANNGLLKYYGYSTNSAYQTILYGMGSILLVIVIIGSITLIHNAFVISINERTKEFGLLSSVGATKKQMKHTILFESFVLCIISIPLGILSGIVGIGITLNFIREPIENMLYGNENIRLTLHASASAIIISTLISIITVLISAYIPMKRALKMSIIDSIKQRKDIKLTSKNVKTPRIVGKLFGIEGTLAYKHYKRNKRSYRTIITSLSLSIILFISAGAFSEYTFKTYDDNVVTNQYDFIISVYDYDDMLEMMDLVNNEDSIKVLETYILLGKTYSICDADPNYSLMYGDDCELGIVPMYSLFVDDVTYLDMLKTYNITSIDTSDYSQITDAILFNSYNDTSSETTLLKPIITSDTNTLTLVNDYDERIFNYLTDGDRLKYVYSNTENNEYLYTDFRDVIDSYNNLDTITINIADTLPFKEGDYYPTSPLGYVYSGLYESAVLIYPISAIDNVYNSLNFREKLDFSSYSLNYVIKSSDYDATSSFIDTLSDDYRFYYSDFVESESEYRSTRIMLNVLIYGFICLISLICIANIFNTISTSMNLRKREFAMLKSYGLSDKQFGKMLNFECIIYSCKGSLYGLVLSLIICVLLYQVGFDTLKGFYVPISLFLIAIIFTIIIIYISIMYSKINQSKDNVVETLQKESI